MLQAYGSGENVVTFLPSMLRTRPSSDGTDGERGRVLLFTGVWRERMDVQADRIAAAHAVDPVRDDVARS